MPAFVLRVKARDGSPRAAAAREVHMKVSEVMTRGVETISSGATIEAAAKKMRTRNIGFLPVVDSEKVGGIVTDRDIVTRAVSEGLRPHMTTVREVMTRKTLFCTDEQTLTEASLLMEKNLVHRLVVFDKQSRLVGIISLSDIAAKTKNERLTGHVLSKVVAA
jgi:IMP dehydrogenase